MKQGERFKMRISEEEKEILESEGIKTFVTNKITGLHDQSGGIIINENNGGQQK